MTKPAFACLPFGHWSRILVGQINRGHYLIASDGERIVGFIGWALTTQEKGDMWLAERGELAFEDSKAGEILLINAWAAESNDVTQIILQRLREIGQTQKMIYFKRLYPDGRTRPVRLSVNAFVDTHIRAARIGEKSGNQASAKSTQFAIRRERNKSITLICVKCCSLPRIKISAAMCFVY